MRTLASRAITPANPPEVRPGSPGQRPPGAAGPGQHGGPVLSFPGAFVVGEAVPSRLDQAHEKPGPGFPRPPLGGPVQRSGDLGCLGHLIAGSCCRHADECTTEEFGGTPSTPVQGYDLDDGDLPTQSPGLPARGLLTGACITHPASGPSVRR
jgi:hypothetical protein